MANTHPIYESPKKKANLKHYGDTENSCICCGKPTAMEYWIHATTDWVATDEPDETKVPDSQGAFPVGPECAKHFPMGFVFISKTQ